MQKVVMEVRNHELSPAIRWVIPRLKTRAKKAGILPRGWFCDVTERDVSQTRRNSFALRVCV